MLQFLGDVNLFHGRLGHTAEPGSEADVSFVRPHELEIVAQPGTDTWPVTLSQTLTVGPHTRIEFRREGGEGYVELPREAYVNLRDRLGLVPGSRVHLRPRRITRFAAAALGAAALVGGCAGAPAYSPQRGLDVEAAGLIIDQRLLDHLAG